MNVRIASAAVESIKAHAAADPMHEVCGVLLGDGRGIIEAIAARNVAAHPERAFEIDPAVLLSSHREARGRGLSVAGWYHSHPGGVAEPSATDAARAVEDGKLWLIAAAGSVTAWRAHAAGALHGRFDLVALDIG